MQLEKIKRPTASKVAKFLIKNIDWNLIKILSCKTFHLYLTDDGVITFNETTRTRILCSVNIVPEYEKLTYLLVNTLRKTLKELA